MRPQSIFALLLMIMVGWTVSACGASQQAASVQTPTVIPTFTPTPTTPTPQPYLGPFIPLGETVHRNRGTTTEAVRNCVPGAKDSIVKNPTGSVAASHNIEWSVAGTSGVGTTIGGGVLPFEINLDGSLSASFGTVFTQSSQRGTGWQLPAEPNRIVTYVLEWGETWQPGYVELRVFGQPASKVDVFYRLDVTSEIVSESATDCSGMPIASASEGRPKDTGAVPLRTATPVPSTAAPAPTATATAVPPTDAPVLMVPNTPAAIWRGPLREHYTVSVGTGAFATSTFSDGMAPHNEQWLWDNDGFKIQRLRLEEQPDGCDVARTGSDVLWVGGTTGMSVTINGTSIGIYSAPENAHGYILSQPVKIGDRICAVGFRQIGYQIIFGPDVYLHYDTYCYRGGC